MSYNAWIIFSVNWLGIQEGQIYCDVLRDLVPFVQFKERKKHTWRSVTTKSNTPPCVFFTFLKLYKWNQIAQRRTCREIIGNMSFKSEEVQLFLSARGLLLLCCKSSIQQHLINIGPLLDVFCYFYPICVIFTI